MFGYQFASSLLRRTCWAHTSSLGTFLSLEELIVLSECDIYYICADVVYYNISRPRMFYTPENSIVLWGCDICYVCTWVVYYKRVVDEQLTTIYNNECCLDVEHMIILLYDLAHLVHIMLANLWSCHECEFGCDHILLMSLSQWLMRHMAVHY